MSIVAAKDSKQQLLQAFQQILADKKKLESKIATKQEEAEKAKNKQILEVASTYTVDSIIKGLADLQLEFGGIVTTLSDKLAKENSKLDELNRAIEIETQNLKELQQIRVVADTLDILTQEHQEKLKTLEQDTNSQRDALEKEIEQTRKDWHQEQEIHAESVKTFNELLAKERALEAEEYQYKLENTKKINTDAFEAKKRQQERQIEESNQEKEKNWSERAKILSANQSLFTEYQQKIAAFPAELEEAVKKSREEAIKETSQKAKVEADLFEKEWEATKQSYELKIQSLEEIIQKQIEQIEGISSQLKSGMKTSIKLDKEMQQNINII
jgi:hypothetical protein